jgi:hypothetical protein
MNHGLRTAVDKGEYTLDKVSTCHSDEIIINIVCARGNYTCLK